MSYSNELKSHLQTLGFKHECCMLACSAGYEALPFEEKCDHCRGSFLRGVFFRFGYLTPPEKDTLLTFDFYDDYAFTVQKILTEAGLDAKVTRRRGRYLIYMKKRDDVSDLISLMGATKFSLQIMQTQVDKQCNEELNRIVNAETANLARTANAAAYQLAAIRKLIQSKKFQTLPPDLLETANLRLTYPEASLVELCSYTKPKLTKSGLNHRLQKLIQIAEESDKE